MGLTTGSVWPTVGSAGVIIVFCWVSGSMTGSQTFKVVYNSLFFCPPVRAVLASREGRNLEQRLPGFGVGVVGRGSLGHWAEAEAGPRRGRKLEWGWGQKRSEWEFGGEVLSAGVTTLGKGAKCLKKI